MQCYECFGAGVERDAVALCHHCSAALCAHHAVVIADPVTAVEPLFKTIVLPKRARLMLCTTCNQALFQRGLACYQSSASKEATDNEQEERAVLVHG
jgi:hypothetical protein